MDTEQIDRADPRRRLYRSDDATLWVWVFYGLAQATITMLMAFDVIETLTATEVCTAVTLILYVAVNELYVRPKRSPRRKPSPDNEVQDRQDESDTGDDESENRHPQPWSHVG